MARRVFAAVDIGASGGRVMAGVVERGDGDAPRRSTGSPTASSSATGTSAGPSHELFDEVLTGLGELAAEFPDVESIGIDTWGVDYGLLDGDGPLLDRPDRLPRRPHRRRSSTTSTARSTPPSSTPINGLQFLPFNTIYQLAADQQRGRLGPGRPRRAAPRPARVLADRRAAHRGHQRVDDRPRSTPAPGSWSEPSCSAASDSRPTCCPAAPAARRGPRRGAGGAARPARAAPTTVVTTVGSHDTASAVVAVPATDRPVRLHRQRHLVARRPRARRADHHRRQPGSQLHQRGAASTDAPGSSATPADCGCSRSRCGRGPSRAAHDARRRCSPRPPPLPAGGPLIDVDDPAFIPPGDMPARIAAAVEAAGAARRRRRPRSPAASSTRWPPPTPRTHPPRRPSSPASTVDVVHVVGGGSQNALLCQLTADRIGPAGRRRTGRSHRPRQRADPGPRPRRRAHLAGRHPRAPRPRRRRDPLRAEHLTGVTVNPFHDSPSQLRHAAIRGPLPADRARPGRTAPGPGGLRRRPAPHRPATASRRRLRLHRRRRRGRTHAWRPTRPRSPPCATGHGCSAASSTSTSARRILGRPITYPLVLAPTGFTRIADPDGELAVARAAARAGLPYTLSTLSTRSIEEVRAVSDGRLWFQVYAWRDRGLVKDMIDRAAESRYEAIVLTVDTAVLGRRERDVRRGFSLPPTHRASARSSTAPSTLAGRVSFMRSEPIRFANVRGRDVGDGASPVTLSDYINTQFDPALSWDDVDWLRSVWDGPIIVKGIQCVADAEHRRRRRRRRDRPVEPRRAPTRRRTRGLRPRRPGRRRRRWPDRGHLRRRDPPRQRHRRGRRRRRRRVHGRPRLPLRARRRRRTRRRPGARLVRRRPPAHHVAPRRVEDRRPRPRRPRRPVSEPLTQRHRLGQKIGDGPRRCSDTSGSRRYWPTRPSTRSRIRSA